ncbi:MAG: hypothetical protein K2P45_16135 [Eubacterium sp.]|nr:hypothetical protein [Eubacterium sp.]
MVKKEIVTLALTAALLMETHAVPVLAAENVPEVAPQAASTQIITPRWELLIFPVCHGGCDLKSAGQRIAYTGDD